MVPTKIHRETKYSNMENLYENPIISVVIPAYNAERFIKYTILSVLFQNYKPLEIIIVNDGSEDNTKYVAEQVIDQYSTREESVEFKIIDIGINKGAANALYVGFNEAMGEYICWLSADDMFIDKKKLQIQLNQMMTYDADWSYFTQMYRGESLSKAKLIRNSYIPKLTILDKRFIDDPELRLMALIFRNPINGSSIMIKKSNLRKYGNFDPTLKNVDADGDLWMRYTLLNAKLVAINSAPVFNRDHPNQTSKKGFEMIYWSELTRLRILTLLSEYDLLSDLIKKFSPYLLVYFVTGIYKKRPISTKYICEQILNDKHKYTSIFLYLAKRYRKKSVIKINNLKIDYNKYFKILNELSESKVFKDFKRRLKKL